MPEGGKAPRGTVALIVLGVVLLAFGVLGGWLGHAHESARIGIHIVLTTGGVVLLLVHVLRWARANPRRLEARSEQLALKRKGSSDMLEVLVDAEPSGADLDVQEAMTLAAALVAPAQNRVRVVEHVIIGSDVVRRRISIEYRAPIPLSLAVDQAMGVGQGTVLVPIARRFKGELLDDFSCFTGSGGTLSVLSHTATSQLLLRIAASCLDATLGRRQITAEKRLMLRKALAEALLQPSPDAEDAIKRVDAHFADDERARNSDAYIALRGLLIALQDRHPLIAAVPASNFSWDEGAMSVLVKYEYSEPLSDAMPMAGQDRWSRVALLIRRLALTRGLQLQFPAKKAKSSDSYHMRVTAPPGCHIADRLLVDAKSNKAIPLASGAQLETPYVRMAPAQYQPSAHLYTRDFVAAGGVEPVLMTRVAEDLPGSLGRSVATAATIAVTVLIVGVLMNGDYFDPDRPRADLLPFLLAVPALMATWAGFGSRGTRAFGSLVAKVSTFATTFLSLGAAALYLAQGNGHLLHLKNDSWALVGVHDWVWGALLLLCLLNTTWTGMTLAVRAIRRHSSLNAHVEARGMR